MGNPFDGLTQLLIVPLQNANQEQKLAKLPCVKYAAFKTVDPKAPHPPSTCHEKTRIELLKEIKLWGARHDNKCIFWLSGMAGTGKSTIARTVAENFYQQDRLGASFFFSRSGDLRGEATALFTTLASQLADALPELKSYISNAIDQDRTIGQQSPRNQWERLILEPLSALGDSLLIPLLLVFVIDALDECKGNQYHGIPELLAMVNGLKGIRVRIFITSRPERPISQSFEKISKELYYHSELDSAKDEQICQTERDISTFLKDELAKVAIKSSLENGWPGKERTQKLVQKAGHLFIYAATACRFLLETDFPEPKLSVLLSAGYTSGSPTKELDDVYLLILQQAITKSTDNRYLVPLFRRVVGSIIILFETLSPLGLAMILDVPLREIRIVLDGLRSVLIVPDDDKSPVEIFHLSFHDFLLDGARCPDRQLCIKEQETHNDLFAHCLDLMSRHLSRDMGELRRPGSLACEIEKSKVDSCLPLAVQYACRYWVAHLQGAKIDQCDNNRVHIFLQKHFLHWLEALSLMGKTSEGVLAITSLESHTLVSHIAVY
jgi:hypothetical protein